MIISDLHREESDGRTRILAHVEWEACGEPERDLFIETTDPFGASLELNPDLFLIGCLHPAMHRRERRIRIEGRVCPQLLETLESVMALFQAWYGEDYRPLSIEAAGVRQPIVRNGRAHTAVFLSGGVDSLTALRRNHLRYPHDHPNRIRDAFLVHGFDIGGVMERGLKYPVFDRAVDAMSAVATAAGLELIPVYTNIRHLCDEKALWLDKFHGAVLAAVAHAFSTRIDRVEIASTFDFLGLGPWASHPMLDQWYGSCDLQIHHRDVELTRLEKIGIIAEWEVALQNLRVCLQNVPDRLNCGWCEKCVRTMTGLVAAGALASCTAFQEDDVTPELLIGTMPKIGHQGPFYLELVEPLRRQGRDDLARIIEQSAQAPGLVS